MTYFEHTEEHELDCDCSFCLDVDYNKRISREIERVMEVVMHESISKLDDESYRKVMEAVLRLNELRQFVPMQELPVKFEKRVAKAIEEHFADE